MASAVDSRLAYARLSAVATASRLPTATRGSNNSYTTHGDTTGDRRSSAGEAAIHLQCSQGAFKRLMNEIAHDQRVEHQKLIAPLGRVPIEAVAPDYCSA